MLWHKMWDVIGDMKGLETLTVGVHLNRFGVFYLTMTGSNIPGTHRLRVEELMEVGIEREAEVEL